MKRICFTASEEKSFENVDNGQTTDTSIYYKLTFGSGELRLRPKMILTMYKGGNPKVFKSKFLQIEGLRSSVWASIKHILLFGVGFQHLK